MNFINVLSNIVAHLTKQVSMLTMNVRERVCFFLQGEMRRQGSADLMLTMSRQDMADGFGIQKYSLQRCLNDLKKEGVIEFSGKHIKVLKPGSLL